MKEHYCWKKHTLLFHDDIHIHECIDETSLSHLKSSCFLCSLFGSDFGGGSSFTSWMKEHMDDYIDAHYIFLEKSYGTWDTHLCHWGISDIILHTYVYGAHGDLLTWMYKHFHVLLMRYLLDVRLYGVVPFGFHFFIHLIQFCFQ